MNLSEYTTLYVLRNIDTNMLILKDEWSKSKMIYCRKSMAQKALNDILQYDPKLNIVIEEIH